MSAGIGGNADGVSGDLLANGVVVSSFNAGGIGIPQFSIDATVAANAMTLTLNPCVIYFRSATLTTGTPVLRRVSTAITTVISSGSTGGTINAVQSDIILIAIDNAGTVELAWTNLSGGTALDETGVISTTAEGGAGAADSATVIYSTTARSNVAYRVVGFVRSTQATAGTWVTAPTLKQGIGGQALAALSSIGYGQTLQNLTGSRALGTTYYNTTGKPIEVFVVMGSAYTAGSATGSFTINGVTVTGFAINESTGASYQSAAVLIPFTVPVGAAYSASVGVGTATLSSWAETR